jgi:hypothetical protein
MTLPAKVTHSRCLTQLCTLFWPTVTLLQLKERVAGLEAAQAQVNELGAKLLEPHSTSAGNHPAC